MPETNDVRSFVHGAEQAEARGDHAAAERLLRRALVLQESTLGAQHPEVANTLNNLAIVCEMTGKLTDAEACYRRAYAIAISSFPASDPFVTTSRNNLEQFCTARAIPFTQPPPALSFASLPQAERSDPKGSTARQVRPVAPPPPPKAAAPPPPSAPSAARAVPPSPSADVFRTELPAPVLPKTIIVPTATRVPSRKAPLVLIVAAVVVVLGIGWFIFGTASPEDPVATETASTASSPVPSPVAPPSEPTVASPESGEPARASDTTPPPPEPVATAPQSSDTKTPPTTTAVPPRADVAKTPPAATAAPTAEIPKVPPTTARVSSLDVLNAELCRSLTTRGVWKCAPATDALTAGPVVYYTRIAASRDMTIEHRWYRDDVLYQRVPLRIRANPSGFRTFSRTGITPERAGSWKVELRTQDGQLLDAKTFVVQ